MLHTKFRSDLTTSYWEEDDNGRPTTDNGRQPKKALSIGYLSDSGDLKMKDNILMNSPL